MESEPTLPVGLPHQQTASDRLSRSDPCFQPRLQLRTIGELCEALPYLMGFHPDESAVLLRVEETQLVGSLRADLPPEEDDLPYFAREFAAALPEPGSRTASPPPSGAAPEVVVVLCSDPRASEEGSAQVRRRLAPLAEELAAACARRGVRVAEVLGVSGARCWSFRCDEVECCPADGNPLGEAGASPVAAAAVYGGLPRPTPRRSWEKRFAPMATQVAIQQRALETAGAASRKSGAPTESADAVDPSVVRLALRVLRRFLASPPRLPVPELADAGDDALLTAEEAAELIVGLQHEALRRRAADWVGGNLTSAATRLWSALARRCVEPYRSLAVPLLALAAWSSWLAGDLTRARIACGLALRQEPGYSFAKLVHQACNSALDAGSFLEPETAAAAPLTSADLEEEPRE